MVSPRIIPNPEIDKAKWDGCVANAHRPAFFLFSFFLDLRCPNWEGLVWGDYGAVMALPVNRKKLFKQVYTPFFMQDIGPANPDNGFVFDPAWLYAHYRCVNARTSVSAGSDQASYPTHLLDLSSPYDTLQKGYSQHVKRALKKAKRQYGEIDWQVPFQEAINHWAKYVLPRTVMPSSEVEFLHKVLAKKNSYVTWHSIGLRDAKGALEAVAILPHTARHQWAWIVSSSPAGKEHQAMAFLLDAWFNKQANQPVMFDFEGSSHAGIARFYQSFGAEKVNRLLCSKSLISRGQQ